MSFSVLQWNIWFEKKKNIISLIQGINPDIICLQEVTKKQSDQAEEIAEELGYHHVYAVADKSSHEGYLGNAVLSRFPIIEKNVIVMREREDGNKFHHQRRVCVLAKLEVGKKEIWVGSAHGSYNHAFEETQEKKEEIHKLVEELPENLVLGTDLNLCPDSESVQLLSGLFQHCGPEFSEPTWTTKPFSYEGFEEDRLRWRVDYVFANSEFEVLSAETIPTDFSDHLPILVKLDLRYQEGEL